VGQNHNLWQPTTIFSFGNPKQGFQASRGVSNITKGLSDHKIKRPELAKNRQNLAILEIK